MCKITEKGIEFSSGEILPADYTTTDFINLSKNSILELKTTKASLFSQVEIKRDILNLRKDIQDMNNTMTMTLKELKSHTNNCPIAKPVVNKMIDDKLGKFHETKGANDFLENKWEEILKEKILSTGNIAKAITAIIIFMATLGSVVYGAIKLASG